MLTMKNCTIISLLTIVVLSCTLNACKKEDTGLKIELQSPSEGSLFNGEVRVQGKVSGESLHNLRIKVTRDADNEEVFSFSKHWHGKKEFSFDEYFLPEGISNTTALTLYIELEDADDQVISQTVRFQVNP